jgi:hypothetical protein
MDKLLRDTACLVLAKVVDPGTAETIVQTLAGIVP